MSSGTGSAGRACTRRRSRHLWGPSPPATTSGSSLTGRRCPPLTGRVLTLTPAPGMKSTRRRCSPLRPATSSASRRCSPRRQPRAVQRGDGMGQALQVQLQGVDAPPADQHRLEHSLRPVRRHWRPERGASAGGAERGDERPRLGQRLLQLAARSESATIPPPAPSHTRPPATRRCGSRRSAPGPRAGWRNRSRRCRPRAGRLELGDDRSARTFGAPVTEPGGNAARSSVAVARRRAQRPRTSETRCHTPGWGSALGTARGDDRCRARRRGRGRCASGRRSSRSRRGPWPSRAARQRGGGRGRVGARAIVPLIGACHTAAAAAQEQLGRQARDRAPRA